MPQAAEPKDWQNWSGSVRCRPREQLRPRSESDLVEHLQRARREQLSVRVAGSGHSQIDLVSTDGLLVSLADWSGVESVDAGGPSARVRAGSILHDLGPQLRAHDLAMENLGDIDAQALAGALATGTHGTGLRLGNLSSQVIGLRILSAEGEILECSEDQDPELLRAARVGLGALGIVSVATLRLVPAFRLHERIERAPVEQCLEELDDRIAGSRHFEFFWYPGKDIAEMKTLDATEELPDELPDRKYERIGWSADIIASVREEKFFEMEYAVPAEAGPDCFRELRTRILARHPDVQWPVEYRRVAADDAYLSPAFGRPTATLSVHQDGSLPFREFFADVESIFYAYAGRPHWGKVHTRNSSELCALYPHWEDFQRVRNRLDPDGRFLNAHLREVLVEDFRGK